MRVVYAKYTSWITPEVQIIEDEAWRADDPIVAAYPDKFAELPKRVRTTLPRHLRGERPVEQATAAPGEKRTIAATTRADAAFDETEELRGQLAQLGVRIDRRWSLARLRDEVEKATAPSG